LAATVTVMPRLKVSQQNNFYRARYDQVDKGSTSLALYFSRCLTTGGYGYDKCQRLYKI
jgi:hypothetical protein